MRNKPRSDAESDIPAISQLATHDRHMLLEMLRSENASQTIDASCVHRLFETQARLTPEAIALCIGDQQLTYQKLNTLANQLAHGLQKMGVKLDTLVGVYMEQSALAVVVLLAILKVGGAYIPMDAVYPPERMAMMLEDAQASVLVTQESLTEHLPTLSAKLLCLHEDLSAFAQESQENPQSEVTSHHLAYVIYTSGSTGKPKGVQIEHRSLLNLILWHQTTFSVLPQDRAALVTSLSFDAWGWGVWPYLTSGSCICLPVDSGVQTSLQQIYEWIELQAITMIFIPTPLVERAFMLDDVPTSSALRILFTGGDKLHHYPPSSLPFTVVNNYGPTENTVVTTSCVVSHHEQKEDVLPPIGKPIANVQVYVLDSSWQPVAEGSIGELYIGGSSLARNYLNRPALTAEAFIPHPFSSVPGARLYRTGDLVSWLPNGQLQFCGRVDAQVKVRGFRVELREIEAVLERHPTVQVGVVMARKAVFDDIQIIACVMPRKGQDCSANTLYAYLKEQLPEYMIPSPIEILESFPLTPNGKIDRQLLLERVEHISTAQEQSSQPAGTSVEKELSAIWCKLLEKKQIGTEENFFELGGHSLSLIQLISSVRRGFGVNLSTHAVFQSPTISQLAQIIDQQLAGKTVPPSTTRLKQILG